MSLPYDPLLQSPSPEKPRFMTENIEHERNEKSWTPIPLRPWFSIPAILLMIVGSVAIEFAYLSTEQNNGWKPVSLNFAFGAGHSIYTLLPVAVSMVVVAIWGWTDFEIKRLQPYVELSKGNASAEKSILLDYVSLNHFIVWFPAFRNGHYAAFLATVVYLVSLLIQPLAANFFVVRETLFTYPDVSIVYDDVVGLNPNYVTLTPFVTAAGYAEAAALFNLSDPPFILGGWSIASFDLPTQYGNNGTVILSAIGILSAGNCDLADTTQFTPFAAPNKGYTLSGTWSNCSASIDVDTSATTQYGLSPVVTNCPAELADLADQYKPVMFWIFTYDENGNGTGVKFDSLSFCQPSIQIYDVMATVDLMSGSLLDVEIATNYSGSNNVTGPPMNGVAMNGINFNLAGADKYTIARANATQSGLPSAIFQVAQNYPGGLDAFYTTGSAGFVNLTNSVYTQFLALSAKNVYFLSNSSSTLPAIVMVNVYESRLWITTYIAHAISIALVFIAIVGSMAHIASFRTRRCVYLRAEPGTLGQAASITANSELAGLLRGHEDDEGIKKAVRNRRFRMDRTRGIIVLD